MIFYIIIIVLLILIISFALYMFHSNKKGKHRKPTSNKISFNHSKEKEPNYYKDTTEEKICTLDKKSIKKYLNSKEININKNIIYIEDNCFFKCFNLSTIKVDKENKDFCSKVGVLFSKDMKKIICYPSLKQTSTYSIPQGVEEIENHAFFNNKFLKYIILPTTLHTIGENAFINCKFISQIVIPQSVQQIHPNAFTLCPRITIRCYKDSIAEEFCKTYFIPFEYLTN